jgi:hypothetical protein
VNLDELRLYLLMQRATPKLLDWAHSGADWPTLVDSLPTLTDEECTVLLAGVLEVGLPESEPWQQVSVQRFLQLCELLGFDDLWIDAYVQQHLGMSLEVVTALAWLQLPRSPSLEGIQSAHRRMAKLYHPDRVTHLAEEFQELARTRTAQLNRARDALIDWHTVDEIVDDVESLPDLDWRDAPTDVDGITDTLELLDD